MKYYISDLHLFHNAAIRFDNRPFDNISTMHEYIHTNWNNRITNGDTVYILGDVSLRGQKDNLIAFVSTLKGQKVLVKGNHDDVSDYRYQQLFSEICDYKEVHDSFDGKNYDLVLSHYPIYSWKNMGRGWIHLYGHTHNSIEDDMYLKALSDMKINCGHLHDNNPVAVNVGCMKPWMGYEPRTLKEILEAKKFK
ncbi:Calcineurin-like phosphoesterase superfamily protein [Pseudobutyrivibrio sp. OR37]|uniref:metallophosphoesterase family protein n=1 Tax=Pseudobutyrivibrio sp. OR37 TaxID=1798186 RepID=UPI0008F41FBB|nr:metallophosphoesterase family protein [Pseudobutyrivibrio sp. OR37]SFI27416.1 Calcineurin-like phosphoesterase superfamily protein [Pseudobutyrivibrio sp. OR37]